MAERSVTIQPGQVNPLGDTLPAGTTLFNLDTKNAVWVSADPGVTAGRGAKIGAYGSVLWQGGACYAVVDTGVSVGVPMTLSDQAVSPVNPVDVAAALAARGVPSVLLGTTIVPGSVLTMPTDPSFPWQVPGSVDSYASVVVYLSSNKPQRLRLEWADTKSGMTLPGQSYILAGGGTQLALTLGINVRAPQLRFYFSDTSATVSAAVYGSNRTVTEGVVLTDPFYQSQIPSQAWAAFQTTSFPDPFTTRGGVHHIRGNANLSGQKGYLVLSLLTAAGAAVDVPVIDSGSGTTGPAGEALIGGSVTLPPGRYLPRWQNSGTAATYSPLLTIIPQP